LENSKSGNDVKGIFLFFSFGNPRRFTIFEKLLNPNVLDLGGLDAPHESSLIRRLRQQILRQIRLDLPTHTLP